MCVCLVCVWLGHRSLSSPDQQAHYLLSAELTKNSWTFCSDNGRNWTFSICLCVFLVLFPFLSLSQTHTHTQSHKQKKKLQISLGTGHRQQCLIDLRGERDALRKTGADLPLLFFSFMDSALFVFPFLFLPQCFTSSYSILHFMSNNSITQSDCS